jgi:hypothetical protein
MREGGLVFEAGSGRVGRVRQDRAGSGGIALISRNRGRVD